MPRATATPDENLSLLARYQQGDRTAGDALIQLNAGLIGRQIRIYLPTAGALEAGDLWTEGALGLLTAASRFDATRGLQFSTYATWWIRQGISRAVLNAGSMIRVPLGQQAQLAHGQEADTATERQQSAAAVRNVLSLDFEPLGEEGGNLGDLLPASADPAAEAVNRIACRQLLDAARLSAREREIVERRFGFRSGTVEKLHEIGAVVGLSKEGVRGVAGRALEKIRAVAG